ncbi:DUF3795 domain-containing protein [Breznakiellaceae bacterium SP9]
MPDKIEAEILAVCGVNCLVCSAYLNKKNACPGCRAQETEHNRKSCINCAKKKCAFDTGLRWCFECGQFPCLKIKRLNKRYGQNYGIDLVQNGLDARKDRDSFLSEQRKQFICETCGGIIDRHHQKCSECGGDKRQHDAKSVTAANGNIIAKEYENG